MVNVAPTAVRPLRRVEWEALVSQGFFDDERCELLDGQIVMMTPQGSQHAGAITYLARVLTASVGRRGHVRVQLPLALGPQSTRPYSEPEPDLAIVRPGAGDPDYRRAHPDHALLVVEVAETSRQRDTQEKPGVYAAAGIPEYWVVDLKGSTVIVYADPRDDEYRSIRTYRPGDRVASKTLAEVTLDVSEILGVES